MKNILHVHFTAKGMLSTTFYYYLDLQNFSFEIRNTLETFSVSFGPISVKL